MAATRADTIAAIATPQGVGGIGVIRVSGSRVPEMAAQLLGKSPTPRYAHFCFFRDATGEIIDSGLLLFFPAPASFTGESVMELQVHGSRPVLHALLRHLYSLGARPARAGEFSERAFLNGKLDLAQTEAIVDLIEAGSESAARAAQRSLQGVFSRAVKALVEETIAIRVLVEAAIDFSDEDIEALGVERLASRLNQLSDSLAELLRAASSGQRLMDGLHVVILGEPNVGKSSLLNALAADERAIVTPLAGTTRDLLRETIHIDGVELTLVDTAGLRHSDDPIEQEGIRRARSEATRADLIVHVVSDDAPPDANAFSPEIPCLVVHNKIDLSGGQARREWQDGNEHLYLSARHGQGMELLRESLQRHAGSEHEGTFSARTRHIEALQRATQHLKEAQSALQAGAAWEICAEDLRLMQHALGEITGDFGVEDLLGQIFSSFCIGK